MPARLTALGKFHKEVEVSLLTLSNRYYADAGLAHTEEEKEKLNRYATEALILAGHIDKSSVIYQQGLRIDLTAASMLKALNREGIKSDETTLREDLAAIAGRFSGRTTLENGLTINPGSCGISHYVLK